jgi:hypothetical protein
MRPAFWYKLGTVTYRGVWPRMAIRKSSLKEGTKMARVSEVFSDKYISAALVSKAGENFVIDGASEADVNGTQKIVLSVTREGSEDGEQLPLNRTNALALAEQLGDDTDEWAGKTIILFRGTTEYRGAKVPAVRVKFGAKK